MNPSILHSRPTPGTILGTIGAVLGLAALIVSLSSSASASPQGRLVRSSEIAAGAITPSKLANGAVKPKAIGSTGQAAQKTYTAD